MLCFKVLEIMRTATHVLSTGQHPTASLILPTKHTILTQMAQVGIHEVGGNRSDDDDSIPRPVESKLISDLKHAIHADLDKRSVKQ